MELCLEAVVSALLTPFQRVSFLQRINPGKVAWQQVTNALISSEGKSGLWKAAGLAAAASISSIVTDESTNFEHKRTSKILNSLKKMAPWEILNFLWDSFFLTWQFRCWKEIATGKTMLQVFREWKLKKGILSFFVCAQTGAIQVAIGLGIAFLPSFQRISMKYGAK
jgi:hypothetical protein